MITLDDFIGSSDTKSGIYPIDKGFIGKGYLIAINYKWYANGTSFGVFPGAKLAGAGSFELECKPTLEAAHILTHTTNSTRLYYVDGSRIQLDLGGNPRAVFTMGALTLGNSTVFKLSRDVNNDLSFHVNGVELALESGGNYVGDIEFDQVANKWSGSTGLPLFTGDISKLSAEGLDVANYPTGTVSWVMNTYAPDNNYQFIDSDNGVVMQLYNAVPDDFTQEQP